MLPPKMLLFKYLLYPILSRVPTIS